MAANCQLLAMQDLLRTGCLPKGVAGLMIVLRSARRRKDANIVGKSDIMQDLVMVV
jgi:hypothetical protein